MLHSICLVVVTGERPASEVSRHLSAFYFLKRGDRAILLNARLTAFMATFGHPSLSLLADVEFLTLDSVDLSLDS